MHEMLDERIENRLPGRAPLPQFGVRIRGGLLRIRGGLLRIRGGQLSDCFKKTTKNLNIYIDTPDTDNI